MALVRIPFELRGSPGFVTVDYGVNDDPRAWGYQLLGLSYDIESARGWPVLQATVEHSAEGYGAAVGWIQIVRYRDEDTEVAIVDGPPQIADAGIPWAYWGVRPTFFDAPSNSPREFRFRANTFLAFSPDAVISREVEPLCGFSWGYDVHAGQPSVQPLEVDGIRHWPDATALLRTHCPGWTFRST
jgi:hypothetical protein